MRSIVKLVMLPLPVFAHIVGVRRNTANAAMRMRAALPRRPSDIWQYPIPPRSPAPSHLAKTPSTAARAPLFIGLLRAQLFYIENIGYVGASGDATVPPDESTDYSGYVNSKADGSGTTAQCTGNTALTVTAASCPAGYQEVNVHASSMNAPWAMYIHQGNACIFSACPSGYELQGTQCVAMSNQCTPGYYCQGSNLRDNCTDEVIEACAWGCFAGSCNPVPSPSATLKAVPSLVKQNNTTLVSWSSQYAATCAVTGTNGDSWTGLNGSQTSSPIHSQTTYTLNCTGEEGADPSTVQKKAIVIIAPMFEEK